MNLNAPALGLIPHVENDKKRKIHLEQLKRKEEPPADILRIHDLDEVSGRFMEKNVPGHLLVFGHGDEGINSRSIHHLDIFFWAR